jgi:hypothetical protein
MTNKQTIVNDLVYNNEYYKEILKNIKIQKDGLLVENPVEYSDEIKKQYKKACSFVIAGILTGRYGISVEECLEVLEDIDYEGYLK